MKEQDFSPLTPDPSESKLSKIDLMAVNAKKHITSEINMIGKISQAPRQLPSFQTVKEVPKFSEKFQKEERPKPVVEVVPEPVIDVPVKEVPAAKKLVMIEKVSLVAFCFILFLGAFLWIAHFNDLIPTRPLIPAAEVFPKNGQLLDITSIDTFWRKPIEAGDERDPVKLGTLLIPSIKLGVMPKQACGILVIFRDSEGRIIGDQITRSVTKKSELKIAASAGLFDLGMLHEIRLNEESAWTVEILENKSADAAIDEFVSVYKGKMKTEQR